MSRVLTAVGPEGYGSYDVAWSGARPLLERVYRAPSGYLVPGFVDVHIHGAFGIDFMSAQPGELLTLCDKLAQVGYEAFLPTTVTASAEAVLAAANRLPKHSMIAGFHLEGPFISPEYPGAQPPEAIQDPVHLDEWQEVLEHPALRLATLAPERPGALQLATRLMERGVVVSMGHTDATYDQARHGFEFGVSHATHLFNAMRGFHHREAGAVGYALMNDAMSVELIYDRLHVSQDAARLAVRCKPAERIVAVSDSTLATGMPAGLEIEMWAHTCVTGDGEVRLKSNGALAGSAITLLDAFRNLAADFGPEMAIHACSLNPRRVLGMADLPSVYLELDEKFEIVAQHRA